jgi:hypothetical protein
MADRSADRPTVGIVQIQLTLLTITQLTYSNQHSPDLLIGYSTGSMMRNGKPMRVAQVFRVGIYRANLEDFILDLRIAIHDRVIGFTK